MARWVRASLFALGVACIVPPLIVLYLSMRYYTIELRPWWIPGLLVLMALFGGALIAHSLYTFRYRRISH